MPTSGPRTVPGTAPLKSLVIAAAAGIILAAYAPSLAVEGARGPCFREDFAGLERWRPFTFPGIKRHSTYEIVSREGEGTVLAASSDSSASGLAWKGTFPVYECPQVRWRWKAERTFNGGDVGRKSGDDYTARVYIVFPFDPAEAGVGLRLKYGVARAFYGEYPPRSALNYVWANRDWEKTVLPNAYTDRSMMFALRGPEDVGEWFTEEIHILRDYREAFGEDPPPAASLVIMNDSDDTGESATAFFDFIEVMP